MSRLRVLLFVYTADLLPSAAGNQHLVGSKRVRDGPTSLINKSAETVLVSNKALVGVIIKSTVGWAGQYHCPRRPLVTDWQFAISTDASPVDTGLQNLVLRTQYPQ